MKARGFSLLEALVTLVIIALVTTLLMQSLVYALGLRERLLRHDQQARVATLNEHWFRDTLSAAQADLPEGLAPFVGDHQGLSFLSAAGLRSGGLAAVAWRLVPNDGAAALQYSEDGRQWLIRLPQGGNGRFDFLDAEGEWHDAWPVEQLPKQVLPRAVRFVSQDDQGGLTWVVVIDAGPDLPRVLQPDIRGLDASF